MEENRELKSVVEIGRKEEAGSVGEWQVVSKGATKMILRKEDKFRLQVANSFDSLCDECDSIGLRHEDEVAEIQDRGKADEVTQPQGKSPNVEVTQPPKKSRKSRSLVIVGDSLCRYVDRKVKHRVRGKYFFPGAGMRKVSESVENWVEENDVVCLIAGGNDVEDNRSEELLRLYRQTIDKMRKRGAVPVICGILPRLGQGSEWLSRAIGINARMAVFCRQNNIVFIDGWDHFTRRKDLYARDGVHLSSSGVSILADLIDRAVGGFG